jgi:hypothetical protein
MDAEYTLPVSISLAVFCYSMAVFIVTFLYHKPSLCNEPFSFHVHSNSVSVRVMQSVKHSSGLTCVRIMERVPTERV